MYPAVTFILGGAAAGKSVFAETLVRRSGLRMVFLATAEARDAEMRAKIAVHTARRGSDWTTIEAPLDLHPALAGLGAGEICLLDCATFWLSNHLLAGHDIASEQEALLAALRGCAAPLVIVSNEVGQGVVPDNALARRFRDAQGRLNIELAKAADLAVLVVAGLPVVLKGTLP